MRADEEKLRAIRIGDVVSYVNLAGKVTESEVTGWKSINAEWDYSNRTHSLHLANDEMISLKRVFARRRPGFPDVAWPASGQGAVAVLP